MSGSWGGAIKTWDVSSLGVPTLSSPTKESTEEDGILVEKNEKLEFDGHSVGLLFALIMFLSYPIFIGRYCTLLLRC